MYSLDVLAPVTEKEAVTLRKVLASEERQVTLRCRVSEFSHVRIWPCVVLRCQQTGKESKLLHSEHIGINPHWSSLRANESFLLLFQGLPKACASFDLLEHIDEPGGFNVIDIPRNNIDVYDISL